jgi:hypothetical protein
MNEGLSSINTQICLFGFFLFEVEVNLVPPANVQRVGAKHVHHA